MSGAGVKLIASPTHPDDASFSFQWLGTIGGAALSTDSAPTNLASVAANRRIRCTPKRDGINVMGSMVLRTLIADGTSLVIRPWYYDATQALWIPLGTTSTMTAASTNTASNTIGNMAGALIFLQIVTNTGNVSALGFDFV